MVELPTNRYWRSLEPQPWPWRDYVAAHFPSGRDGFVVLDQDGIVRVFGPEYDTDEIGRFRYVEVKSHGADLTTAQWRTYQLCHESAMTGVHAERYDGFYLVSTETEHWEDAEQFVVRRLYAIPPMPPDVDLFAWTDPNTVAMTPEQFDAWFGWDWSPWWPTDSI